MAQPLLSVPLHPLPATSTAAATAAATALPQPNFNKLISTATSLPHLKQIHAHLLKNPHHAHHHHHLFNLLLSSLSYPSYALSLLTSIPAQRPPPPQLSNKLLKHLSRSNNANDTLIFFQTMQKKAFTIDRFSFPPLLKAASKAMALKMKSSKVEPDDRIFTTILSACSRFGNLDIGKLVHGFISDNNIVIDSHLQSVLVNMYASSGALDMAQSLYDKLKPSNVVASTAMISGYSKVGNVEAARKVAPIDNMSKNNNSRNINRCT
ncbi:hypothetical protein Salat_0566100 [Sesamum alatum]|uniref:Pentatricopeptide repeat-containing protein n=1 Tax=Sesamum alatum TaxID=300844 RepID=A0AAE1YPW0_9LAMI|nr:hypothetical protein Salat_0566100 [Sesamum alatum]